MQVQFFNIYFILKVHIQYSFHYLNGQRVLWNYFLWQSTSYHKNVDKTNFWPQSISIQNTDETAHVERKP